MKILFFLFTATFIFFGCSQENKKPKQNNMNNLQATSNKRITYGLQLSMKLPYELYINDIKADYDYVGTNSGVEMNPYLLSNGKCIVKIKIFPAFKAGKTEIPLDDLKSSTISFGSFVMNGSTNEMENFDNSSFQELKIQIPDAPVPFFEKEWELEIKDLSYELKGWSEGQDLSKINEKDLEEKVLKYYKKIHNVLDSGNYNEWMKLTKLRFDEFSKYKYLNNSDIQNHQSKVKKDIEEYAKNTMVPIEDYHMKLYANGKIVALEKNIHTESYNNQDFTDIYGWGALISKGKVSGAADYPILLYLPQNSDEFVIIRK